MAEREYKRSEEVRAKIGRGVSDARKRFTPIHAEHYRSKIKTGMLINRLHQVGSGKVEASPGSIQACIALLRKVLPDLQSTEIKGTGATTTIIVTGVVRAEDLEQSNTSPLLPEMKDVTPK
jgi:hypothetical protein